MYLQSIGAKLGGNSEWRIDCPFCGGKDKLYVASEIRENQFGEEKPAGRWTCFRCEEQGMSFARLMAEIDSLSISEARRIIRTWNFSGVNWKKSLFREAAAKEKAAKSDPESSWLPEHFEPVSKVWTRYLTERKVPKKLASSLGLGVCRAGRYEHRVILPLVCPAGRSFTARTLINDRKRYDSGPNSGGLLFGWNSIEWMKDGAIVIVEGPFDAMRVMESGYSSVAIMGKQLRDSQRIMLRAVQNRGFVVMLDPEARSEAITLAHKLWGRARVALGMATDPGDATPDQVRDAVFKSMSLEDASHITVKKNLDKLLKNL